MSTENNTQNSAETSTQTPVEINVEIPRAVLEGADAFASTDKTRYVLNGVYLFCPTPTSTVLAVATDGRSLVATAVPEVTEAVPWEGPCRGFIIPSTLIKAFLKSAPKTTWKIGMMSSPSILVTVKGIWETKFVNPQLIQPKVTLFSQGVSLTGDGIEGTYPQFQAVIPKGPFEAAKLLPGEGISTTRTDQVVKAAKAGLFGEREGVTLTLHREVPKSKEGETDAWGGPFVCTMPAPILFSQKDGGPAWETLLVIMPTRNKKEVNYSLPSSVAAFL